ncbi:MAG: hypothetical protein OHK0022_47830 [Roseiflexaceae bacterium]
MEGNPHAPFFATFFAKTRLRSASKVGKEGCGGKPPRPLFCHLLRWNQVSFRIVSKANLRDGIAYAMERRRGSGQTQQMLAKGARNF